MKPNQSRYLAFVLCMVYFSTNVVLASSAETNFWSDRKHAVSSASSNRAAQYAALPAVLPSLDTQNLLNQMPSVSSPLPMVPKWNFRKQKWEREFNSSLQKIVQSVPLTFGSIQDVYDSGDSEHPPVVLMQDVHLNIEAQKNIAFILQDLIDQKQAGWVGVEGAFGSFDFSPFRKYSNSEITRQVVEDSLQKKLLGAPSFVGITSSIEPPSFIGIDDKIHYEKNLEALYSARDQKPQAVKWINKAEKDLKEIKIKKLSKRFNDFDDLRFGYRKGSIGLGAYVKKLSEFASVDDIVVNQFLEAYAMEADLDFKRIEFERRKVIEKLTRVLSGSEISALVAQSLAYRMGRLDYGDYYQGIKELCESKSIHLSASPYFDNYIRYVLLADGIRAEQLFSSIEELEDVVVKKLARSEDERTLIMESEKLSLTEKLIEFSLTPQEWQTYRSLQEAVKPGVIGWDDAPLSPFESFYAEADIRSQKMVSNLLEKTNFSNKSVRHPTRSELSKPKVIIAGGFHSPQVAHFLRRQKVSYVIVSPKLTKFEDSSGSAYLSVFSREKTPLDRLFAGEELFVYPAHLAVGTGTPQTNETEVILGGVLELESRSHSVVPVEEAKMSREMAGRIFSFNHGVSGKPGDRLRIYHTSISKSYPGILKRTVRIVAGVWQRRFDSLTKIKFLRPAAVSGGLIGKYEVIIPPVFDAERKIVRFRGRHIETRLETDIEIPAEPVEPVFVQNLFMRLISRNSLAANIIDEFLEGFWEGTVLVIKPNSYGIRGLASHNLIAVEEAFKNNYLAYFHELAESLGSLNDGFTVERILSHLDDRSWFDAHMQKPGRKRLALHYAIRALQREAFPIEDREFSRIIKGLLSASEILRISKSAGVIKPSAVLTEFRSRHLGKMARSQELALVDEIVKWQLKKEQEDEKEKERQSDAAMARDEQRLQSALKIRSALALAEEIANNGKIDSAEKADQLYEIFVSVQSEPEDVLADELIVAVLPLVENSKRREVSWAVRNAIFRSERVLVKPEVKYQIIKKLFPLAMSLSLSSRSRIEMIKDVGMLMEGLHVGVEEKKELGLLILSHARMEFRGKLSVPRVYVGDIPFASSYFDVDPDNPRNYLFRSDFAAQVQKLRNPDLRKTLESLYRRTKYNRDALVDFANKLIMEDTTGVYISIFSDEFADVSSTSKEYLKFLVSRIVSGLITEFPEKQIKIKNILRAVFKIYQRFSSDPDFQRWIISELNRLCLIPIARGTQKMLADFFMDSLSIPMGHVDEYAYQVAEARRKLAQLQKNNASNNAIIEAERIESERYFALAYAMRDIEQRLRTIEWFVMNDFGVGLTPDNGLYQSIIERILRLTDDKNVHPYIRSEAASVAQEFVAHGSTLALDWYLKRQEPNVDVKTAVAFKNMSDAAVNSKDLRDFIRGNNGKLKPRTIYILLRRHAKNNEVLRDIIFDKSIDVRYRMAGFSWYSMRFLALPTHFKGGGIKANFNEMEFREMAASLQEEAGLYVKSELTRRDRIRSLFIDDIGQDDEALVYITAIFLTLHQRLPVVSAKGWTLMASSVALARVRSYSKIVDSKFDLGGRFFQSVRYQPVIFFQVVAHELMHSFLVSELGFDTGLFKNGVLHELLADLQSFLMADILESSHEPFEESLHYSEELSEVEKDDYHTVEVHEGARAQLRIIKEALSRQNQKIDSVKMIQSGLGVIRRDDYSSLTLDEAVVAMFKGYLGQPDYPVTLDIDEGLARFFSPYFTDEFEVPENHFRGKVVDVDGIMGIFRSVWPEGGMGSILEPLFASFRKKGSWGGWRYGAFNIIVAPLVETYFFQSLGFVLLNDFFSSMGIDTALMIFLSMAGTGTVFAFAHTIVAWLVGAKQDNWKRDAVVRFGLSFVFTIPFLFLNQNSAFILSASLHALYNAIVMSQFTSMIFPMASIGGPEDGSDESSDLFKKGAIEVIADDANRLDVLNRPAARRLAEALSKTLFSQPSDKIVELVNRVSGQSLLASDLTGKVQIRYHDQGNHKLVFRLEFIRTNGDIIPVVLAVKREKQKGDITKQESTDLQRAAKKTSAVPKFGSEYRYQDEKGEILFFVEEFIQGETAYALKKKRRLSMSDRVAIVAALLSITTALGYAPRDSHAKNFIIRKDTRIPVMVDLGERRLQVLGKNAILQHKAFFLAFLCAHYGSSFIDGGHLSLFEAVQKNRAFGLPFLNEVYEYVKSQGETAFADKLHKKNQGMLFVLAERYTGDYKETIEEFTFDFLADLSLYLTANDPARAPPPPDTTAVDGLKARLDEAIEKHDKSAIFAIINEAANLPSQKERFFMLTRISGFNDNELVAAAADKLIETFSTVSKNLPAEYQRELLQTSLHLKLIGDSARARKIHGMVHESNSMILVVQDRLEDGKGERKNGIKINKAERLRDVRPAQRKKAEEFLAALKAFGLDADNRDVQAALAESAAALDPALMPSIRDFTYGEGHPLIRLLREESLKRIERVNAIMMSYGYYVLGDMKVSGVETGKPRVQLNISVFEITYAKPYIKPGKETKWAVHLNGPHAEHISRGVLGHSHDDGGAVIFLDNIRRHVLNFVLPRLAEKTEPSGNPLVPLRAASALIGIIEQDLKTVLDEDELASAAALGKKIARRRNLLLEMNSRMGSKRNPFNAGWVDVSLDPGTEERLIRIGRELGKTDSAEEVLSITRELEQSEPDYRSLIEKITALRARSVEYHELVHEWDDDRIWLEPVAYSNEMVLAPTYGIEMSMLSGYLLSPSLDGEHQSAALIFRALEKELFQDRAMTHAQLLERVLPKLANLSPQERREVHQKAHEKMFGPLLVTADDVSPRLRPPPQPIPHANISMAFQAGVSRFWKLMTARLFRFANLEIKFTNPQGVEGIAGNILGFAVFEILKNDFEYIGRRHKVNPADVIYGSGGYQKEIKGALDFLPAGDMSVSFENPGNINPADFSLEKLRELKRFLEHLYFLVQLENGATLVAPHSDLVHMTLVGDFDFEDEVRKYIPDSIGLVSEKIHKLESGEALVFEDARQLMFSMFVTSKTDLFKANFFDWRHKNGLPNMRGLLGGRGVGLAWAKIRLNEVGMDMDVESGNGATRFIITIPQTCYKVIDPKQSGHPKIRPGGLDDDAPLLPGAIFDPILKPNQQSFSGKLIYLLFTGFVAPLWETYVFQYLGFSFLTDVISSYGLSPAGSVYLSMAAVGVTFAFAHTIVAWLVDAKQDNWKRDFFVRFGLSLLFTIPFLQNQVNPFAFAFAIHATYNLLVFHKPFSKSVPAASILTPESSVPQRLKIIRDNYLFSKFVNLRIQEDDERRGGFGKGLGGLAREAIRKDPSGTILRNRILPLYREMLNKEGLLTAAGLFESIGELFGAMLDLNSIDYDLVSISVDLYKFAVGKNPFLAQEALGRLTRLLYRADPSGKLIKDIAIPLYDDTINTAFIGVPKGPSRNFEPLLEILIQIDPSGELLKKEGIRLYQESLAQTSDITKSETIQNLGPLAHAIARIPNGKGLLDKSILPLYQNLETNPNPHLKQAVVGSLGGLAKAYVVADPGLISFRLNIVPYFHRVLKDTQMEEVRRGAAKSLEGLTEALYAADNTGELLVQYALPFYRKALGDTDNEVRYYAVKSLGRLGELLILSDPTLERFKKYWWNFYLPALRDSFLDVRSVATSSLGKCALALRSLNSEAAKKYLLDEIVRLFEENIRDENPHIERGAVEGLGMLATALFDLDPSGKYVNEIVLRLYHRAFSNPNPLVFPNHLNSLEVLADILLQLDPTGKKVVEIILPLYKKMAVYRQERVRQIAARSYGKILQVLYRAEGDQDHLGKDGLPLLNTMLQNDDGATRKEAAGSLGLLAENLDPQVFNRTSAVLPEYIGALEGLDNVNEALYQVAYSALSDLESGAGAEATDSWVLVIDALFKIKNSPSIHFYFEEVSRLMLDVLAQKGGRMQAAKISGSFKKYFPGEALPKRHQGPKDLIAHIWMDMFLRQQGLPAAFGERLRRQKNSPSYSELMPLLMHLVKENPAFFDSIREYERWSEGVGQKDMGLYWGSVFKILMVAARDWSAFEQIQLMSSMVATLKSYEAKEDVLKQNGGKVKFLQTQSEKLQKFIPNYVGKIFHFNVDNGTWIDPTEKEINILIYVGRNKEYAAADHPLNQALRPYFEKRAKGGSVEASVKAYQQHLPLIEGMKEQWDALSGYLDETGLNLRGAPAMEGRVFLSGLSLADQQLVGQWNDAVRHLWELGAVLPSGDLKGQLSGILEEIAKNKNPSRKDYSHFLQKIQLWMEAVRAFENLVNRDHQPVFDTIQAHLDEVKKLLQSGSVSSVLEEEFIQSKNRVMVEAVIRMTQDPIEMLHLGWPSLGGSCLDCVNGTMQKYAAGYILNPSVRVIYIRDKANPVKPLARFTVAFDAVQKTLFLLSPIKTSSSYEFQPLVGKYLEAWAKELGVSVVAPVSLGYNEYLGFSSPPVSADLNLSKGLVPFYSDLTGQKSLGWSGSVRGYRKTPSSIGGLMLWLKRIVISSFHRISSQTYDRWMAPVLENSLSLLAGGIFIGVPLYYSTGDLRMVIQIANLGAWIIFFSGHLVDFANKTERAPPMNLVYAGVIAAVSSSFGLLPLSYVPLLSIVVAGSTIFHWFINRSASTFSSNQKSTSTATEAAQIADVVRASGEDRKAAADAILGLVGVEKVIGDNLRSENQNRPVEMEAVLDSFRQEIRGLVEGGRLDSAEERARLADLVFILKSVLTDREFSGFVGALRDIPARGDKNEMRSFVSWVNTAVQAKALIREIISNQDQSDSKPFGRLVLGFHENNQRLLDDLKSDPSLGIDKLIREGRLEFVRGDDQTSAYDFVAKAKSLKMFSMEEGVHLNLLVLDGVSLPNGFFNLTKSEWDLLRRDTWVYFINEALQAVEVKGSLLPDWNVVRQTLIYA